MFGRRKAAKADPEALEEARAWVKQFVLPGFVARDEVKQAVVETLDDSPLDEATIYALVDEVWASRVDEERAWQDEGDYTKLAAAFSDLQESGLVARMNFACCQNCGHTEIKAEATGSERGYVFFHQQDSERLAEPDAVLHLAYDVLKWHPAIDQDIYARAVEGDEEARNTLGPVISALEREIASDIVSAMQRQGLRVERRDEAARPAVHVPEWRKRLPA